jgi:hypothetical protein
MIESFWSTIQRELLDRQRWATRADLGSAIFEWIEAFYNPRRRHSAPWVALAMTVLASFVQVNGRQRSFQASMNR